MSTVIQKVKILLDEHQEPFIPFTTSDSIFINGTDERLTDYLDNYYQAGDGIEIDPDTHTISATANDLLILPWDGSTGTSTAVKEFFQQVVDAHAAGKDVFVIGRKNSNLDKVGDLIFILRKNDTIQTGSPFDYYKMLGTATASVDQSGYDHSTFWLTETNIHIYGQLTNNGFVVNNVITADAGYQLDYLDTQGVYTTPYIPNRDDRPATKKYVDDAVANVETECLGYASQFKTSANAIRIDLLEEHKVYYILNDRTVPDANGLYFSISKNGTILTTSIGTWDNQKVNVYYLCKNKSYANPETQGTFYTDVYYRRLDTTSGALTTYSYDIFELNNVLDKAFSGKNYYYLTTDQQQTITAKKTFDVLPVSSVVPTTNSQLVNKKYVDDTAKPTVTTSTTSTYTIDSLTGNKVYKLGEITALTITAITTFDVESTIYFESGTTPTDISIPDSLTNLGDVPTLTTSDHVSTGTCTASKNYIVSIQNNIAIWKEY